MKLKQKVGDDLSVCVQNLLLKVNTQPSLVAKNIVKNEYFWICHVTSHSSRIQRVMWFSGWQPLTLGQHRTSFGITGSSASGDVKYLTCEVTSRDYLIEGSCKLMGESCSRYFITLKNLVTIGIVKMKICLYYLTTQDHMFKGLCFFMGGSLSPWVTALQDRWLLVVCTWRHKIFMWFVTWLDKTTFSKAQVTLWVGTPHCMSPPSQVWWP